MRKTGMGALVALGLLGTSGGALAATADGTLITNVACATYSALGVGFSVSYCTTAVVQVSNPCVALQKIANPTVQASGGTVTFFLWIVNCSATVSAFSVTLTDRLPDNTSYSDNVNANEPAPVTGAWFSSYSSDNVNYVAGAPGVGQGAPYYLRWQFTILGPNRSAFVTYTVNVL